MLQVNGSERVTGKLREPHRAKQSLYMASSGSSSKKFVAQVVSSRPRAPKSSRIEAWGEAHSGLEKLLAYTQELGEVYNEWEEFRREHRDLKSIERILHNHQLISDCLKGLPTVRDPFYYRNAQEFSVRLGILLNSSRVFMKEYASYSGFGQYWHRAYFEEGLEDRQFEARQLGGELMLLQAYGSQVQARKNTKNLKQNIEESYGRLKYWMHTEITENGRQTTAYLEVNYVLTMVSTIVGVLTLGGVLTLLGLRR